MRRSCGGIALLSLVIGPTAWAAPLDPTTVATFHSIGLYWDLSEVSVEGDCALGRTRSSSPTPPATW